MAKYETRIFYFTDAGLTDLIDNLVKHKLYYYTSFIVENDNKLVHSKPSRIIVYINNFRISSSMPVFKQFYDLFREFNSKVLVYALGPNSIDVARWQAVSHLTQYDSEALAKSMLNHFQNPICSKLANQRFDIHAISLSTFLEDSDYLKRIKEIKLDCIIKKLPYLWIYDCNLDTDKIEKIYENLLSQHKH